ncbi:hypothetical protein [Commensalibacter nepenthis]|uniref:Uncharacterized protein n=1 Tax=Commensalibacter nepenthis TaxID=3043872 RepID=A0ABT6Q5B2_9PROT|nr:hypothetical protein [Commensalibacter sp. TBRC 10068]MDI2112089.1 hypothetical protein [Commensalibacter sp. TBRC 10068]
MDQEIEVGEVKEDGLRLWCARLSLEYAKEEAKRLDDAVQRLKNRANSLVGWTVTISIALCAVFFMHPVFYFSSLIMLIFILITACLCVATLYSTPWVYTNIKLQGMDDFQNDFGTELEIIEKLTLKYERHNQQNTRIYYRLQKCMKGAWISFLVTPFIGFLVQLLMK